jgi:hypothetical protein
VFEFSCDKGEVLEGWGWDYVSLAPRCGSSVALLKLVNVWLEGSEYILADCDKR